jgi:hypothetical protein
LKLEIGLRPQGEESDTDQPSSGALDLTEEDLRILRSMKIKIDPEQ